MRSTRRQSPLNTLAPMPASIPRVAEARSDNAVHPWCQQGLAPLLPNERCCRRAQLSSAACGGAIYLTRPQQSYGVTQIPHSAETMKIIYLLGAALLSACHLPRNSPVRQDVGHPYASAATDCRSAEALLRPSDQGTPIMSQRLWRLRACPARAGMLLAEVMDSSRQVSDTGELHRRTWPTQYVHDSLILAAAMNVASDGGATVPARLAALRTLIWQKTPGHMLTMAMMMTTPGCIPSSCASTYEGHFYGPSWLQGPTRDTTSWPVFGAIMPTGYADRIDSLLTTLGASGSDSTLRRAAGVALRFPPARRLNGR
jgi:hypothetical protein